MDEIAQSRCADRLWHMCIISACSTSHPAYAPGRACAEQMVSNRVSCGGRDCAFGRGKSHAARCRGRKESGDGSVLNPRPIRTGGTRPTRHLKKQAAEAVPPARHVIDHDQGWKRRIDGSSRSPWQSTKHPYDHGRATYDQRPDGRRRSSPQHSAPYPPAPSYPHAETACGCEGMPVTRHPQRIARSNRECGDGQGHRVPLLHAAGRREAMTLSG